MRFRVALSVRADAKRTWVCHGLTRMSRSLSVALVAALLAVGNLAASEWVLPKQGSERLPCHLASEAGAARSLIDAHLHYSGVDAAQWPPAEIIALLDRQQVDAAVVSGAPNSTVQRLYQAAPDRILPFLNVYQGPADKRDWMRDRELPLRAKEALARGVYRGIGELHIFAQDRDSQVLAALVDLAAANGLMLLVHGDAEVIETIFARAPQLTVLWAHLGTDPRPEAIAPMLARYPGLFVDTSVRDGRFVDEQGCVLPQWERFFVDHASQVLIGVDTHWPPRWERFGEVAAAIRAWLAQLPPDVAHRIGRGNAARLFGIE